MTLGSSEKISNALIQLQRRLKKELKAEIKKGIRQEKTSVVGGSSTFTNHDPSNARRKTEIERMRMNYNLDEARSYLDKKDQDKHYKELKPEAKRDCFYMLALTLHMSHPNPSETNWFNFGFCTGYDEGEEGALRELYKRLLIGDKLFNDVPGPIPRMKNIQKATFTEFWKAYESGTMIQLMDLKGFRRERLQFPFLEEFFSSPPFDIGEKTEQRS
ncbi:hypothetical protein BDV27DRAFT_142782 [Aspergillus caelatus]|uniref:Uncharacterized protein n=1 Tax=Aspergillus caelatus TaxID=61420 RepID=A0A5N7AFU3_9EURO|nr:uncharacterized protein BDV27DRAFT_142782 [Aspergillus caelatus]KAE8367510.1 hypothetical protein BDV27DRAFT_142782 [Aspergillus caelatus]